MPRSRATAGTLTRAAVAVTRTRSATMPGPSFAVIDFETTGLFPGEHDRVIEVAVVHSDPHGTITGRWETLINPGRDLGPQRLHQIRAADVMKAPFFVQIAGQLLELLRGRVLVAHCNARRRASSRSPAPIPCPSYRESTTRRASKMQGICWGAPLSNSDGAALEKRRSPQLRSTQRQCCPHN